MRNITLETDNDHRARSWELRALEIAIGITRYDASCSYSDRTAVLFGFGLSLSEERTRLKFALGSKFVNVSEMISSVRLIQPIHKTGQRWRHLKLPLILRLVKAFLGIDSRFPLISFSVT